MKKKKKPAKKPAARKPRRPAAIAIACPSCGAAPMQLCLLLSGAMGHRRRLEEALKFNAGVAAAPALHAARLAAYDAQKQPSAPAKPSRPEASAIVTQRAKTRREATRLRARSA